MGKRFAALILKAPILILIVGLGLTLGAGYGVSRVVINNDLKVFIAQNSPVRLALDHLEEVFGSSETMVLMVSHPDRAVFEAQFLGDLQKVTKKLKRVKGVSRVQSLATADRFDRDADGNLAIEKFLRGTPDSHEEALAVRDAVLGDRDVNKAFVSKDGRATAIYVDPKPSVGDDELIIGLRAAADKVLPGYEVQITGMAAVRMATNEVIYNDLLFLMPAVTAALVFFLFIALRSWVGVVITLVLIFLSIIPAAGVMGLLGIPISPPTATFPVLVLAVVCGDSIHILTAYFQKLKTGMGKREAVSAVVTELTLPVFLTSATSAAGFLGMLSSPLPPMGGLGIVVAVGIMWAWGLSTLVLPSLLVLIPAPKIKERKRGPGVEMLLERVVLATTTHAKLTFVGVIAVLGLFAGVGLPALEREVRAERIFAPDHWVRQAAQAIDAGFQSSAPVEVIVEGDASDPELFKKMAAFGDRVQEIAEVGSVDSAAGIVSRIQKTLTGEPGIPDEPEKLSQLLLLYSISGSPDVFQRLVATDGSSLRMTIRLPNLGHAELDQVIAQIERIRDEELAGVEATFTGQGIMMAELNRLVVRSAVFSIGLALLLVFIICALTFRSLATGLDAMAPLALAIVGVFGAMGLTGIPLSIASALITSIVIGVGIDFGVHFLARWRLLAALPQAERLYETVLEVGRPILLNAFTVAAGLAVLSLSRFEPIRQLGMMAVFAMLASAFGALILLPLLKTYRHKENSDDSMAAS